ncbi:MAG TPA: transcriptional regulator [Methanothrix soehngenii]|jgi:putative transcriptional regulator|nr:transcriptional regulator [Methanothrix soehngenii]MCK9587437.1 transcriptional regulator [Methanothrix soehngenii]MDD4488686.1 transcriptional regulator [Methanothrix soehngenii]MDD5257596.1 transcriptional regulator [Methanothrix soehngenii]MDD5735611.1 transcriptional regulator [Methanothrix soehngenii]HOG97947.1 transcriptional regulator [Methanothrix soehngenii]
MMDKELLAAHVEEVLREAGFSTSDRCYLRPRSFDLAARRDDQFLFLKILSNIDGLNERTALEIRRLAKHLLASPILVGEKTRDQYLERGAVYFRYGIPTLSLFTLADCLLEGALPLVYAAHGGLYVRIDGDRMRQIRLARGISLGALATELGVSRRTISKYEVEDMDTSVDVALKLEEIFNEELIEPVDPFQTEAVAEVKGPVTDNILRLLLEIGFEVVPTAQAPFNAITREGKLVVLTGVGKFSQSIIKKARLMSSLSSVARTKSVVIVDGETKLECIEETVLIEKRELEDIDETRDFEDLVAEKKSK